MSRSLLRISAKGVIIWNIAALNIVVLVLILTVHTQWIWGLACTMPLAVLAVYNIFQQKHTILRNYPVVGYFRYIFESIRPELRQYFWETDMDGRPFNRKQRSLVYQRAKNVKQTVPFGTTEYQDKPGHEWVAHSVYPVSCGTHDLRVTIGNDHCSQPYNASILNISAMSYGALSSTAIRSLNGGAQLGGFAHNTGEGGISEHHLTGGDLIWQVGTGYFGCRDNNGHFFPELFKMNATRPEVKMIELKLSQGAKPGHGGILPATKNTPEIAAIRNLKPYTTVHSPRRHSAFNNAIQMMHFIGFLRELSEGKPVGFKLCLGDKQEFIDICNAITVTRIIPDFITVDGSEGGTGAAPVEFSDNIGMPLYDAVAFVAQTLEIFNLRKHIKIIAAGKIITAFDILKTLALGADACYSARGMMMAMGCIQALKCDSGVCPAGIATQDPRLYKGLRIDDKKVRVANFHRNTIKATIDMMEACGFENLKAIDPARFYRKTDAVHTKSLREIYFGKIDDRLTGNWFKSSMLN